MKTLTRILLTFLSFTASYYFIYWLPFSLIPGAHNIPAIPIILSLAAASVIGIYIWKKTGSISSSLSNYSIMGGVILGSIGFIIGFFGPIIFSPSSNQGPLLGILITGPIGFLIGFYGGGIYWKVYVKNKNII